MLNLLTILFLLIYQPCKANDLFVPLQHPLSDERGATFNTHIKIHDILYRWSNLTKKNIIIKNLPNQTMILNITHLRWPLLLKQLERNFDFKIRAHKNIYTIEKNSRIINSYKLKFISTKSLISLKKHLKLVCANCTFSLNDKYFVWYSCPDSWAPKIKQAIQTIDQPSKIINIRVRLIKTEQEWFSNWGKSWIVKHKLPNSWLTNLINPTNAMQNILLKPNLTNQFIEHLLATSNQCQDTSLIAESNLRVLSGNTTTISSGVMFPVTTKDSRNRTQTIFKPVELVIEATPRILKKPLILINFKLKYDKRLDHDDAIIGTTNIASTLTLNNKQTIVLSSLNTQMNQSSKQKNLLSKLPILGNLFDYNERTRKKTILLIVINASYDNHNKDKG